MSKGELELVSWLRERCKSRAPHVKLGIGDDMGIVSPGGPEILVTSDMLLDGVHFDSRSHPLELIGRKAIACSLSDCAAMAVQPLTATVSLALPDSFTMPQAHALYEGMLGLADRYECAIVGGDTNSWPHPLAIDVTIVARPYDDCRPILRSGAKMFDLLFVTGPLGGSLNGRHLAFEPRVHEAHRLAGLLGNKLHAMMDISDGLSMDLHRMCQASGVGAWLIERELNKLIHPDAKELTLSDGRTMLDHVLSDGEDFELLVSIAVEAAKELPTCGVPLFMIGQIMDGEVIIVGEDQTRRPLPVQGYEHFR